MEIFLSSTEVQSTVKICRVLGKTEKAEEDLRLMKLIALSRKGTCSCASFMFYYLFKTW